MKDDWIDWPELGKKISIVILRIFCVKNGILDATIVHILVQYFDLCSRLYNRIIANLPRTAA